MKSRLLSTARTPHCVSSRLFHHATHNHCTSLCFSVFLTEYSQQTPRGGGSTSPAIIRNHWVIQRIVLLEVSWPPIRSIFWCRRSSRWQIICQSSIRIPARDIAWRNNGLGLSLIGNGNSGYVNVKTNFWEQFGRTISMLVKVSNFVLNETPRC